MQFDHRLLATPDRARGRSPPWPGASAVRGRRPAVPCWRSAAAVGVQYSLGVATLLLVVPALARHPAPGDGRAGADRRAGGAACDRLGARRMSRVGIGVSAGRGVRLRVDTGRPGWVRTRPGWPPLERSRTDAGLASLLGGLARRRPPRPARWSTPPTAAACSAWSSSRCPMAAGRWRWPTSPRRPRRGARGARRSRGRAEPRPASSPP